MDEDSDHEEFSEKVEQVKNLFSMCKKEPTTMRMLLDHATQRGIYTKKFSNFIEFGNTLMKPKGK